MFTGQAERCAAFFVSRSAASMPHVRLAVVTLEQQPRDAQHGLVTGCHVEGQAAL